MPVSKLPLLLLGLAMVVSPAWDARADQPTVRLVTRRRDDLSNRTQPAGGRRDTLPPADSGKPEDDQDQRDEDKLKEDEAARRARIDDLYRIRGVDEVSLDIRPDFPTPDDSAKDLLTHRIADPREIRLEQGWSHVHFHWAATNFWHRPLYFEDILLERHGQTAGPLVQPLLSGLRFFGTIPMLPYKAGIERPRDRVYTLGYGRPGNWTHPMRRRLPFELDAALFQAGAICGVILLLP